MKKFILKSNYKEVSNYKKDCLSLKYNNLPYKKGFIPLANKVSHIRLLLDNVESSGNENEIIQYLNDLFVSNPNIKSFCINVEDQKCFEKAKKIMCLVKAPNKVIKLYADSLLRDRTSLDLSNLCCTTIIPLQYVMWHNEIEKADRRYIKFDRRDNSDYDGSKKYEKYQNYGFLGDYYTLDDVLKLKRFVLKILNSDLKFKAIHSDLQKVLLVSQYMSNKIIYPEYHKNKGFEVLDRLQDHKAFYTLLNKEGVCEGQAEAFMLLLNNPIVRIDCRVLVGTEDGVDKDGNKIKEGHAWNILKIRESRYHFLYDQTWHNESLDFEYTFTPIFEGRQTLAGVGGYYNIYPYKLPNEFLKEQLKKANQAERTGTNFCPVSKLDIVVDNIKKRRQ